MRKACRIIGTMAVAAVVLAAAQAAQADVITTNLGDRGDGYTVVKFTYSGADANTGTWTIPTGVTSLEVLVVGGGGGAANDNFQSGAGAGGMYYSSAYSVTPGSIGIAVGVGAFHGTGGTSSFGTQLLAYGGTKGDGYTNGGDQGGYSLDGGSTVVPGNPGMHYAPMDGNWCSGGGAGGAGLKGDWQLGGPGAANGITGAIVYYAGGGGAPSSYASSGGTGYNVGGGGTGPQNFGDPSISGIDGLGGGGGGGWGGATGTNGQGGDGVVIVAYMIPEPATFGLLGIVGAAMLLRRRMAK